MNSGSRAKAVALDVTPCPLAHLGLFVPTREAPSLGSTVLLSKHSTGMFPTSGLLCAVVGVASAL